MQPASSRTYIRGGAFQQEIVAHSPLIHCPSITSDFDRFFDQAKSPDGLHRARRRGGRRIKEEVSGNATHRVSAYLAAVDQTADHGDELPHGPYSCTPAGCYVPHCRPETRTATPHSPGVILVRQSRTCSESVAPGFLAGQFSLSDANLAPVAWTDNTLHIASPVFPAAPSARPHPVVWL